MIDQFLQFLTKNCKAGKDQKFLIAVSGGLDSMVLCNLFLKSKLSFAIAHCNFQLRGKASEGDEKFVTDYASKNKIPFFIERFATKNYAKQHRLSTQIAARNLRYDWFEKVRLMNGFDYIVTAHHQTDSLETILINLVRGTGLAGLHGILAKQKQIIRPLLFASRTEIEIYARKHKIKWREDDSNSDDDYLRNRLLHHVLPVLKSLNPSVEKTFAENAGRFLDDELLLDYFVEELSIKLIEKEGIEIKIKIHELIKLPFIKTILFHLIKPYGFKNEHALVVTSLLQKQSGKRVLSKTHQLIRSSDFLSISPLSKTINETVIIKKTDKKVAYADFVFEIKKISASQVDIKKQSPDLAYVDFELLNFPMEIRSRKDGDWFQPFGMKGKKKLSDFFTDLKLTETEKNNCPLVVSGNKIVWVAGYRIDEKFKITAQTKNILQLTLLKIQ